MDLSAAVPIPRTRQLSRTVDRSATVQPLRAAIALCRRVRDVLARASVRTAKGSTRAVRGAYQYLWAPNRRLTARSTQDTVRAPSSQPRWVGRRRIRLAVGIGTRHKLVGHGRRGRPSQGLSLRSMRQQPGSDVDVHAWARSAAAGSPLGRMILVVLADSAEPDHTACVSLRALVDQSGAARSTVLRALNDLEARGLLSRRSQFDADGARLPSRFHLNCSSAQRLRRRAKAVRSVRRAGGVHSRQARASGGADSRWEGLSPLLPVADAAPLLGISPHTVYRLVARDELPVRRVGPRRVYIDTVRLRDLLDPLPR